MVARVRRLLREEIERRYPVPPGQRSNPGGQRAVAVAVRVSQALLNQFLSGKKSVGIDALIAFRAFFVEGGTPMTIDELLGLDTDTDPDDPPESTDRPSQRNL